MRTIIPVHRHLFALAIVCCWMAGLAAAQTSSGARALTDAFVQGWNAHDARAFGRLYADDAEWIAVGGERHRGHVAVEGALAKEHASWARTTTLRATDVVVREIDSENAIVMFRWEVTRAEEGGARPLRGNTLLVAAHREGRWIIVVGQAAALPMPR
jgi:uncharacterized protein (TIGR02246 family)